MAITHVVSMGYNDGTSTLSYSEQFSGNDYIAKSVNAGVTSAVTGLTVSYSMTRSKLQAIQLVATTNCTVKTNSTTGVDTFTLVGSEPVLWSVKSNLGAVTVNNVFTADVTALFLTAVTACTLLVRSLEAST